jgi:hypothetical protein
MGHEENKHREGVPNYEGKKKDLQLELKVGSLDQNSYTYT